MRRIMGEPCNAYDVLFPFIVRSSNLLWWDIMYSSKVGHVFAGGIYGFGI